MANDFCKVLALQEKKYMVEDKKQKHRNKPNRMSDANSYSVTLRRIPQL